MPFAPWGLQVAIYSDTRLVENRRRAVIVSGIRSSQGAQGGSAGKSGVIDIELSVFEPFDELSHCESAVPRTFCSRSERRGERGGCAGLDRGKAGGSSSCNQPRTTTRHLTPHTPRDRTCSPSLISSLIHPLSHFSFSFSFHFPRPPSYFLPR